MIFTTHELKSKILTAFKDPHESLAFFIKDDNFHKFIENLMKFDFNLEYRDPKGNTLLNLAVQCESYKIAEYLLDLGADVNTQNVSSLITFLGCVKYTSTLCFNE
jgi:ankyrin repeat protein